MTDNPVVAGHLPWGRVLHRLHDLAGDLGRRAGMFSPVRMFPDRVAGDDYRHFDAVAVLHPERFARPTLVRIVLENQDGKQAVGLAGELLVSPLRVRRIVSRKIKADDARACPLHQFPGAPSVPGEQFPAVGPIGAKPVWVVVPSAPFDERIIGRACRPRILDCFRTQLRQVSETAGPTKRNLPAVGVVPIALATTEEVTLEPLHVVAVSVNETDGAASIAPVNRNRIKALRFGCFGASRFGPSRPANSCTSRSRFG